MPLAREAKIPAKRLALNRCLKAFNTIVVVSGALTIVMVVCLQQPPKFVPGWLLIFLGGITMAGGLSGYGGTTLPCCYMTHLIATGVSGFGNMVFSLCLFGQRPKVLNSFGTTRYTADSVDKFLVTASWLFLTVTIIQMCLIPGRIILQNMKYETFETLEETRANRGQMMSQMRREVSEQEGRVDKTISNKLEERMAGKYGE
ncbi:hypothetical protein R1flu_025923 [Riccia fluitans]|uniref:Uncharacterized protein n=1 Tax=Riccia fluitans TaxID=41844 RepID=A0ABD1Y299_9MARC